MSELENCCGTTCDKEKLKTEFQSNETLANRIAELSRTVSTLDAQINRVLNERVDIENILFLVGAGKLPLLTVRDCQVLAIKLGTPKKHWSDVIKNYKLENLQ